MEEIENIIQKTKELSEAIQAYTDSTNNFICGLEVYGDFSGSFSFDLENEMFRNLDDLRAILVDKLPK